MYIKIIYEKTFYEARDRLPFIRTEVENKILDFKQNPNSNARHFEKISKRDEKIFSIHVNRKYVIIMARDGNKYYALWVDHHDEAYRWARNRRFEPNERTGVLQDYEVPESTISLPEKPLFDKLNDVQLLDIGVPNDLLNFVHSFAKKSDLISAKNRLPRDVYEYLIRLEAGVPYQDILKEVKDGGRHVDSIDQSLELPLTKSVFCDPQSESEEKKLLAEPLEAWRVFLHPTQRRIAEGYFKGPARVLGGAGTGKTVVAMHRAKFLASKCKGNEKVLFTTYNSNLAIDIKNNLKKICTPNELNKIDVINLDSWIWKYLSHNNISSEVLFTDKQLEEPWEQAIKMGASDILLNKNPEFYKDEWAFVVGLQDTYTEQRYLNADRKGSGIRLSEKERIAVWKVFEAFINIMKSADKYDAYMAMYKCRWLLQNESKRPYRYVIVDEGQDFSDAAYKLIREIAGTQKDNDIFIVGDPHQRIYKHKTILSKCGIDIRLRSSYLKINYRTTEAIRKRAYAVLEGINFDDMDGGDYTNDESISLSPGENPQIITFSTQYDELNYIKNEMNSLISSGVKEADICLIARTRSIRDNYCDRLKSQGIDFYKIHNKEEDRSHGKTIRAATMHRAKGLEFRYVFIVSANWNVIPLPTAKNNKGIKNEADAIASERSLLYVAMTRAQKMVYITSYGYPSPFLQNRLI